MVDATIKIFVVIPVYNSAKYLGKCIESVIGQSYTNWEAIIIDDNSTDDSLLLASKYAEKDSRIKIISQDVNQGPGITRNNAIEFVSKKVSEQRISIQSSYMIFIDSDDWIERDYFQCIVDIVNKENADVIFVDIIQEDISGKVIKFEPMSAYKEKSKETILRHQMTGKLPWGCCRKAVRTELILENNIRFLSNDIGEEAIYSFILLSVAKKICFIESPLYHYVIHPSSQSNKRDNDPWGPVCQELECYLKKKDLYDNYKSTLTSFAFTALIVSIYRNSQYYSFRQAIKNSKEAVDRYRKTFSYSMDKNSLETRIRLILPFAKLNLVGLIVFISKLNYAIQKLKSKFRK